MTSTTFLGEELGQRPGVERRRAVGVGNDLVALVHRWRLLFGRVFEAPG
jgi:hypothetical protein